MAQIITNRFKEKKEKVVEMKNKRLSLKLGKTFTAPGGDKFEFLRVDIEVGGDIGDAEFASAIEDLSDEGHELLNRECEIAKTKHIEG